MQGRYPAWLASGSCPVGDVTENPNFLRFPWLPIPRIGNCVNAQAFIKRHDFLIATKAATGTTLASTAMTDTVHETTGFTATAPGTVGTVDATPGTPAFMTNAVPAGMSSIDDLSVFFSSPDGGDSIDDVMAPDLSAFYAPAKLPWTSSVPEFVPRVAVDECMEEFYSDDAQESASSPECASVPEPAKRRRGVSFSNVTVLHHELSLDDSKLPSDGLAPIGLGALRRKEVVPVHLYDQEREEARESGVGLVPPEERRQAIGVKRALSVERVETDNAEIRRVNTMSMREAILELRAARLATVPVRRRPAASFNTVASVDACELPGLGASSSIVC